jgi:hypothetical protein
MVFCCGPIMVAEDLIEVGVEYCSHGGASNDKRTDQQSPADGGRDA